MFLNPSIAFQRKLRNQQSQPHLQIIHDPRKRASSMMNKLSTNKRSRPSARRINAPSFLLNMSSSEIASGLTELLVRAMPTVAQEESASLLERRSPAKHKNLNRFMYNFHVNLNKRRIII